MEQLPDDAACLKCGYLLRGLPEPRCPECSRSFDPNDPKTYVTPLRRHTYGQACRVLLAWIAAYILVNALLVIAGPGGCSPITMSSPLNWWPFLGPLLWVFGGGFYWIFGVLQALIGLALILAHPIRPRWWTALLTILGYACWWWGGFWVVAQAAANA
ncbi:MAG: hypothetical protein JSU63_04325 [Phycisphaerales bacterium]|nr:MAG: hypothetical protein JSU63_04325 [Phycisphaerales bacterium]